MPCLGEALVGEPGGIELLGVSVAEDVLVERIPQAERQQRPGGHSDLPGVRPHRRPEIGEGALQDRPSQIIALLRRRQRHRGAETGAEKEHLPRLLGPFGDELVDHLVEVMSLEITGGAVPPPALAVGAEIESHPNFPNRTNVSFIRPVDAHTIDVRFYERGAGETMSSGTGSTGAAAAAILRGLVQSPVTLDTPAGTLNLRWDDDIYLTGPAEIVAGGEFYFEGR